VWEWNQYRSKGQVYPWSELLISIGVAFVRRVTLQLGAAAIILLMLQWFYRFHWLELPVSFASPGEMLNGVMLFLGVEFLYYWQHRFMHQVRWFWADHSVHHSPNRLVFAVAGRLGWFNAVSGVMLFFAPLCLLGFSAEAVVAMTTINLFYQVWLHTEQIGKLGWLEWVLNTPSHHRVHHGVNVRYLDANYGGILIIFDRLFGTFVEEAADEPVRFGLVQPQRSRNPFVVALQEWANIATDVARHWRHPRRVWHYLFNVPGWSHDDSRVTTEMIRRQAQPEA
jgi:sterol desaturase/sphingolipid hydroxylase (fatty acid hydroxylase superfamily)